jgi:hypothetical protein
MTGMARSGDRFAAICSGREPQCLHVGFLCRRHRIEHLVAAQGVERPERTDAQRFGCLRIAHRRDQHWRRAAQLQRLHRLQRRELHRLWHAFT